MRGKGSQSKQVQAAVGITPAYAGKRIPLGQVGLKCRDHPRLCGEKLYDYIGDIPLSGSPPPMRGKAVGIFHTYKHQRITPAYAGKSLRDIKSENSK